MIHITTLHNLTCESADYLVLMCECMYLFYLLSSMFHIRPQADLEIKCKLGVDSITICFVKIVLQNVCVISYVCLHK